MFTFSGQISMLVLLGMIQSLRLKEERELWVPKNVLSVVSSFNPPANHLSMSVIDTLFTHEINRYGATE